VQKATVEEKVSCWLLPAALAMLSLSLTEFYDLQSILNRVPAARYFKLIV